MTYGQELLEACIVLHVVIALCHLHVMPFTWFLNHPVILSVSAVVPGSYLLSVTPLSSQAVSLAEPT